MVPRVNRRLARWTQAIRIGAIVLMMSLTGLASNGLAQQPETITWMTTTAIPTVTEESVKRFMAQHPDIRVNWRPTPSGRLRDVALSILVGNPDDLDVMAVFYGDLASFAEAGFITNLEGLPWVGALKQDLNRSAKDNATYKGAFYGIPYFHAVHVYAYNMRLLRQAGFTKPPTTWDEVNKIAEAMQQKRMFKAPIVWPWNVTVTSDSLHWTWELITASKGGTLWDKALKPRFLETNSPGYRALQWMVDGVRKGLIDRTSFELDPGKIAELIGRGEIPFGFQISFHELVRFNTPESTPEAGNFSIGPGPDGGVNVARTDIFAVTSQARARGGRHWQAVQTFMQWLADPKNFLRPYGAFNGRTLAYKSFDADPEVQTSWNKWAKREEVRSSMAKLKAFVDIVPQYMYPYFPQLRDAMNQEIQKALLGQQTVDQALQTIARRANELANKK